MLNLDIKAAHKMVREQRALGNDVEWQNYDIVFYRPDERAVYTSDGRWRNGKWAFENRFSVNSEGTWNIESRNLKRPRRSRSRR